MAGDAKLDRRLMLTGVASVLAAPSILWAQETTTDIEEPAVSRNISSFVVHDWRDHFDSLGKGILLSDTVRRVLQHWTSDGEMRVYPTSVPLTDDLTRRGYTEVIEKRKNPSWAPTPAMRERNPEWPPIVKGGDPANPLGTRALYLSWQYYRIHGTQDTRKIGRRSSNGCIGLFNEQIEEVYDRVPVGAQVKLI
ncbi:L,D-transpeptidase [Shimia thalassica]|uniref:L,D-transpeptidase n=1 Tax=Shimia litoralis TaxID=420403 RepID=A0A4U7MSC2_9RHOB|nr:MULTISPECIES: L,D-transpeptidase [Shimia]MDP2520622.1 L,D-transpeptidase [Shimia thalassica]MDP2582002.1 L,D-transpeptidase [Shimia thalassica]TKZ15872.1 L,D-transpeptidase [Shimia litoralis]